MNERDEVVIDLREIFYLLRKRFLIILLTAMVFALGSGIYSFFIATPIYSSTAKLYILTQSTSITSLADIQMGSSLTLDYMELIKSRPVVNQVIENANLDMDYEELLGKITLNNPADTRILSITVEDEDRYEAARIANEFASVSKKQISDIMMTDQPTVAETAFADKEPVKPQKERNIAIAFLLGAFLSALVVIIIHILDDTIKDQDDVELYLGLNTLAVIPLKAGAKKQKRKRKAKDRR